MEFKKVTPKDRQEIEKYVKINGENNCETDFINLLLWQDVYGASILIENGCLIMKTSGKMGEVFSLPFGDMQRGVETILEYTGGKYPVFRAQQGARLDDFIKLYGDIYDVFELDSGYDYIYLREDLSLLKGKKYHAKRNHISSFTKQFNWVYEEINENNLRDVTACAEEWYRENADRFTKEMAAEKSGVLLIAENYRDLGVLGGAIRVDGKIVAFTFASCINEKTVDIHIEKALKDYSVAYTVINNEFVKRLPESIIYINREDDLGLEGLKKAKLSYHPVTLLKKYVCKVKENG